MNCSHIGTPRVAQVRITAPEICEVHGWQLGSVYPTLEHEIWTPDRNGQQIYIQSATFNRAVEVFDTQYELLDQDKTGPEGLTHTMAIRKHRKTIDPALTITDRLKLVIGNVLGIHEEDITPSKKLDEDFSADSYDRIDLVYSLENEFDIAITDREIEQFVTVGNVLDYLTARVGTQQG